MGASGRRPMAPPRLAAAACAASAFVLACCCTNLAAAAAAGEGAAAAAIARSGKLGAELRRSPPWEDPQGAASTGFPAWLTAVGERHDERLRRRLGAAGSQESMVPGWGDDFGVAGGASYVVAQDGSGQYSSISEALAQVPFQNVERIVIVVKPGIYKEKVVVPWSSPYVTLQGSGAGSTIITWSDYAGEIVDGQPITTFLSCTLCVDADHFIASGLVIRGLDLLSLEQLATQLALITEGQTPSCWQECTLRTKGTGWGTITAQNRNSPSLPTGFVFLRCNVSGVNEVFLGRAWGAASRVVFAYTFFDTILQPGGWSSWTYSDDTTAIFYGVPPMAGTTAIMDGPPVAVAVLPAPVLVTKYMQRQQAHEVMLKRFNDRRRQAAVRSRAWRVKRRAHIARGHKYRLRHRRSLRV
eukprot:SM000018S03615  [mRNA]  locus=s18:353373:356878:+ [translate_table: standard]